MADPCLAQEYISFDAGLNSKGMLKRSNKLVMACLVALAFGAFAGTMMGRFVWARHEANVNLDSKPVAEQMKMAMAHPIAVKHLAESLKAAALGGNATLSSEAQAAIVREIKELMANPKVVEEVRRATAQVKAMMADSAFQEEKPRLMEQIKPFLANLHADMHADMQDGRRLSSVTPTRHLSRFSASPLPQPIKAKPGLTRNIMGKRDVSAYGEFPDQKVYYGPPAPKKTVPLLRKLGDAKVISALSELGLLSAAEKNEIFSQLEQAGVFSTVEKLLPIADKLGVLQFLGDAIDAGPKDLAIRGGVLLSIGPVYAALASQGIVPAPDTEFPAVLVPGVLFTASTGGGAFLLALSNLAGKIGSTDDPLQLVRTRVPFLRKLGEKQFTTAVSELGLLSAAEKAKAFSTIEKAGGFSIAESLLPLADDLRILQFLQGIVDTRPEDLYTTGGFLLLLGPFFALCSLGPIGLVTGDIIPKGSVILIPLAITSVPATLGLVYIALALGVDKLKEED
jgi:hypothetical protein